MLRLILISGGLVVVVAAIVLAYAVALPNEFRITRTARINAKREKIFPLIDNLQAVNQWNPFAKQDRTIALSYSGPECGKGAAYSWTSQGRAGNGSLEITDTEPGSSVTMLLHMRIPMGARSTILFALQPSSTTTTDVTWSMSGRYAFVGKLFGVVCNMDKMVGAKFDKGLAELKAIAEKS